MATNPAVRDLYPFSTKEGTSIPLEVIGADFLIKKTVAAGVPSVVTVPNGTKVCAFYSTELAFVDLLNLLVTPLADGTVHNGVLFLPQETSVVASLDGNTELKLFSEGAATIYIQGLRKWAGIGLETLLKNR